MPTRYPPVFCVVLGPLVVALLIGLMLLMCGCAPRPTDSSDLYVQAANPVDAGRYLVVVGGCNDCHTAGYAEAHGDVPESEWLTGTPVGFRGPWGTSYASNLRLLVQDLTEEAWVTMTQTRQGLPPMPWPSLNHMSEADARAIYQFLHALGPRGETMPVALGPPQEPATPYFNFEPLHMERLKPARLSAAVIPAPDETVPN